MKKKIMLVQIDVDTGDVILNGKPVPFHTSELKAIVNYGIEPNIYEIANGDLIRSIEIFAEKDEQ